MSQPQFEVWPDVAELITEDDEPEDNLFSETQQRLLTEPLYSSWAGPGDGRPFLAAANIGVFYLRRNPAIVPDVLLSLDVEIPAEFWNKQDRAYYLWEFGKAPDVAIEIVSNKVGGEDDEKKAKYARMRVGYYVIFDPYGELMPETLTVYRWNDFQYAPQSSLQFPSLSIGLTLWTGKYEGKHDRWLRWVDADGNLIPTGKERADQERQRAERLAEMLRQLGKNLDQV